MSGSGYDTSPRLQDKLLCKAGVETNLMPQDCLAASRKVGKLHGPAPLTKLSLGLQRNSNTR